MEVAACNTLYNHTHNFFFLSEYYYYYCILFKQQKIIKSWKKRRNIEDNNKTRKSRKIEKVFIMKKKKLFSLLLLLISILDSNVSLHDLFQCSTLTHLVTDTKKRHFIKLSLIYINYIFIFSLSFKKNLLLHSLKIL